MTTTSDRALFLRRSLQLDGIASGLCGAVLVLGAAPVADLIGVPSAGLVGGVGALLLVYAGALLWNARRPDIHRGEVRLAVLLNGAWVAGSLALILAGPRPWIGNLAVAAVAAAVLVFAVLEAVGLRRVTGHKAA